MNCQSCGAAVPPDARFCATCGRPIGVPMEERRVVTVLFADLVGFTSLSEGLDPEQVKRIVDRAFERLVRDVNAFGGRIDKIVGDAIVALFGAPIAHEDDAERAVRAALRMQETLGAYAAEAGMGIRMRIGVNTGEVLVGALRAGGDYTAMGDVVNTASRLQTSADPGTVVVGESTYAATKDVIVYEPRGTLFARGREQPVNVWTATEAVMPPGYRPWRAESPLVGRDAELLVLDNLLQVSLRNGRHQRVLLVGEAGVGKTRVANEIGPLVLRHRPDAWVLNGRCVPYGEANPWWPLADAMRHACGIDMAESVDDARAKVAAAVEAAKVEATQATAVANGLLHLMGYEGPLRGLDPGRAKGEASQSLLLFLEASLRERPIVLRIADLHWADDMVLELLDTLSHELSRQPFVLVGTARRSLLRRWSPQTGRFNSVALNVDPLDRTAAEQLLDVLLTADLAPDLRDALLDRSGGNPFYLEELVTLTEGGAASPGELELPDTLRGLVSARIDGLTLEEQLTLEDAAVWGAAGPMEALQKIGGAVRGVADVTSTVASLDAKEVLRVEDGEWSFRSDLVREVAYARLTKTERVHRHLGIAEYLEALVHGRVVDDGYAEKVAHHYLEATRLSREMSEVGVPADLCDRALRWIDEAARRAQRAASWAQAERLFGEGLELAADEAHEGGRLEMLMGRAKVRCEQWDFVGARGDASAALAAAEEAGDVAATAWALTLLGEVDTRDSSSPAPAETLARAVALFDQLGDRNGRAEALRWSGMASLLRNDPGAAVAPISEALDHYRAVADRRGEAWALQNLAWIALVTGDPQRAEDLLDGSARAFGEIGDTGGMAWAMGLLAFVRLSEGRLDEAHDLAVPILRETERRGDHWAQGMMSVVIANIDLWQGRTEEAARNAARAVEIFDELGDAVGKEQAFAVCGRARVMTGHVGAGLALLERAEEHGGRTSPEAALSLGAVSSLSTRVHLGDPSAWQRLAGVVEEARAPARGARRPMDLPVAAALALAQEGDVEGAQQVLDDVGDGPGSGAWLSARSLVDAAAGDVDAARAAAAQTRSAERASYMDLVFAGIAEGLTGDAEGFARARAAVEPTGDRLARAILALAEGVATGNRSTAASDWLDLGIEPAGWTRLFEAAAQLPGCGT